MDPASSALLSKLIRSEIELARVFLSSSRAAYRLGNHQDGDMARQKAEAAYSRALKIAEEISEAQRQILVAELGRLKMPGLASSTHSGREAAESNRKHPAGWRLPGKGRRAKSMSVRSGSTSPTGRTRRELRRARVFTAAQKHRLGFA